MMKITTINPDTGQIRILGRDIRFWIITGIGGVAVIALLTWFLTTATVRISYRFADQAREGKVSLQATTKDGQISNVGSFLGLSFIPRSTATISAKTDNSQTIMAIDATPLFSVPSFNLELQPQRRLSKISSDGHGCTIINATGAYSYNCTDPNQMSQINRPDDGIWTTTPVEGASENMDAFDQYKDGLLAIQNPVPQAPAGTPARLAYLNPGAPIQFFPLPKSFSSNENDILQIYTDHTSSANDGFVLSNRTTGDFLYASSLAKLDEARQFKRTASINTKFDASLCSLNQTQLACYYGPAASGPQDDVDGKDQAALVEYRQKYPHPRLETTQLSQPDQRTVYELKDITGADIIFKTASDNVYLQSGSMIQKVNLEDSNNVSSKIIATKASSVGANSTSVFYATDNGAMEYIDTEQTTYLRFSSEHLKNYSIKIYGDNVIINAFLNVDESNQYAQSMQTFLLSNNVLGKTEKRKEDLLPYTGENLGIYNMDYSDTMITVRLTPRYTNHSDGTRSLNTALMNANVEKIRKQLELDGFLTNGVKLVIQ